MTVVTKGSYVKSYYNETVKKVHVWVDLQYGTVTNHVYKAFRIRGSAVDWEYEWDGNNNLAVLLYDSGKNNSILDEKNKEYLFTIRFNSITREIVGNVERPLRSPIVQSKKIRERETESSAQRMQRN